MSGVGNGAEEVTREMDTVPAPGTQPRRERMDIPSIGGTASNPDAGGPAMPSGLDKLRAAVAQVQAETVERLDLSIPGYAGTLGARYTVPDYEAMRDVEFKIITERNAGSRRELHLFIDEIILCCECMLIQGDAGEWVELRDSEERTVGYDERLAQGLDISPVEEARDVVLGVFAKKSSRKRAPYLIAQHHAEVRSFVRAEGGELADISPGE